MAYPLGDPRAVRINEWLASAGPLSSDDFVELYNPNPLPVDLGGFYLTDTLETEPDGHRLSPLTFIAGQGYAVFDADGQEGPDHAGFRLSADGEIIALFDAAFHEIDKVIFGAQMTDVSQGRFPDGAAHCEYFAPPTPGSPNAASTQAAPTVMLLIAEAAAKRAIVPASAGHVAATWKSAVDFDDSDWLSASGAPGGVGFERSSGYEHLISLDVGAQMYGRNTTCYIRIPFYVLTDPASTLGGLYLSVRYDDGFVAYLNGVEVGRVGFDGTPAWNSAANANHEADSQGFDAVLDLSTYLRTLRRGSNLLAIQGLNVSTTSSDFLVSAVLEATVRN